MEHPGNIDETIFTCVKKWLNGTANKPVTWEFLLEALEGSELKEASTDLRSALTSLEGLLTLSAPLQALN